MMAEFSRPAHFNKLRIFCGGGKIANEVIQFSVAVNFFNASSIPWIHLKLFKNARRMDCALVD